MIELWFLYTALSLMGLILRIRFYQIPFDSLQVMFQTRKKEIVHKCPQLFLTCLQDAESYVFRQSVIFRKVLVCIVLNSENINKTSKFHWFTVWEHVTKSYDGAQKGQQFLVKQDQILSINKQLFSPQCPAAGNRLCFTSADGQTWCNSVNSMFLSCDFSLNSDIMIISVKLEKKSYQLIYILS